MSEAIAVEIQAICRRAAEPIRAGESIKAQLGRAWLNLGRPAYWRLRDGWYGYGGNWSASAVIDFQTRYRALLERHARRAAEAQTSEDAKNSVRPSGHLEEARAAYRSLAARVEALEAMVVRSQEPPRA